MRIKKLVIATLLLGVWLPSVCRETADFNVVPRPSMVQSLPSEAPFILDSKTLIIYPEGNDSLARNAHLLAGYLKEITGLNLKVSHRKAGRNVINLRADLVTPVREAYEINVSMNMIDINGASAAGNFYGVQTLRKATPGGKEVEYPAVVVADSPRFAYRGAHLDVVRHFFPLDTVKKFIDLLALHNINTFHWHLSDDQGWRIEIPGYPGLKEKAQWRSGTCVGKDFSTSDSIPYGGFFSRDDAREIVRYAAERYITVIPEIDLPGHMVAALSAYPHLGCTGGPYDAWTHWGVSEDLLCAGKDSTYIFIDDVLTAIADIFPSKYIHIGGDECPKERWKECGLCQAKIRELGIEADSVSTAEQKLQTYVMRRAAATLRRLGRNMIGWDEILEGGPVEGGAIMSWTGPGGAVKAVKQGMHAILTPCQYCYFDYYQVKDRSREPLSIGGYIPLEKVYSFEPVDLSLTTEEADRILGVQANLWTEYIADTHHLFYNELPRLAAMAEVQWCQPQDKNFKDFRRRLPRMLRQYEIFGYPYAPHLGDAEP